MTAGDDREPSFTHRVLSRPRTLVLLEDLAARKGAVARTRFVSASQRTAGAVSAAASGFAPMASPGQASGPGLDEWDWLPDDALKSDTGLVLIVGAEESIAIAPPFPLADVDAGSVHDGAVFRPLVEALNARRLVGIILLRLGAYAVGVADGGELAVTKTGTRYVKGRHRAGGQSQRRFERNRATWVARLFGEVCEVAESRIGPYAHRLDALAVGGDRHVLGDFLKRCRFAADLDGRLRTVQVQVDRPGRRALERAAARVWSSDVWQAHFAQAGPSSM